MRLRPKPNSGKCDLCLKEFEDLSQHLQDHRQLPREFKLSDWDKLYFLKDMNIQPWEDDEQTHS